MHISGGIPRFGLFAGLLVAATHQTKALPSDISSGDGDLGERLRRAKSALEELDRAIDARPAGPSAELDHQKFAWADWTNVWSKAYTPPAE